jgi:hypothetical protein
MRQTLVLHEKAAFGLENTASDPLSQFLLSRYGPNSHENIMGNK